MSRKIISQQTRFRPNQFDPNLTPMQQSAVGAQNAGGSLADGLGRAIESTRIYQDCLFSLGYRGE